MSGFSSTAWSKALNSTARMRVKVSRRLACRPVSRTGHRGLGAASRGLPVWTRAGTHQPIGEVERGDLVVATDPVTGTTSAEPVTDIIVGDGIKELVDVGIDTDADGTSGTVTATDSHPFYVAGRGWTDAGELRPGDTLHTPDGTAFVTTVRHRRSDTTVRNPTVRWLHTFYVVVDDSVFTHNCAKK